MATAAPAKHSKVSKAKGRLMMDHPFFATLLLRTEIVLTDRVELAATDGDRMYFNPEFLDKLSVEDVMVVMCHEIGHDSLLHSIRLGARNHDLWNQACDHAINLTLKDQGMRCPTAVPGGWLCDEQYKGWSADRIYAHLQRNPPKKQNPQAGPGEQNGSSGTPGAPQPGRDWLHGDIMPNPAKGDPAAQAAAEQKAKRKVASAANMARMAGKLKGELARMVGECLETKVDWTDVLRDKMLQVVKERDNWGRRNRRFTQFYLPTRRSLKMGSIIFIPDTSGSMWGDDMEKICSEMAHCAAQTQPESIRVIWADTRVAGEQEFTADEFEFAALKPQGGGGTDMRVPLAHVEEDDPLVVVLMTDGFTPWPAIPPSYPLIIICTTDQACPDYAETIRI